MYSDLNNFLLSHNLGELDIEGSPIFLLCYSDYMPNTFKKDKIYSFQNGRIEGENNVIFNTLTFNTLDKLFIPLKDLGISENGIVYDFFDPSDKLRYILATNRF